ncbi:hypothetical protein [Desulfotignum phosphitoxidans]|uniref:Porin n=1 Tax=Desulfotignum phosphitoxidans DSM 13687 TaxID=1286635 RepID=S0FZP7_9BACT|nr:hypothetical protein [Desulfotignum phosphitoxidans]EMS78659.1 hypothetical protein Dpo_7c01350 [Desulfotignum phosphitoxidans DSM 13687]
MKKLMVLVAALALVAGSAMTAAAADWNFYGSARIATFFTDLDQADTTNYGENLQGNSRIGATVKVSDEVTGGFEYGTGVNVRKLYGEWNFGAGSLLVGQTYTPLNYFYSNQVYGTDNDMLAQGGVYSGREGMLRLKFGGFQIAVLAPKDPVFGGAAATEVSMPGIEANYNLVMDNFSFNLGAGYQSYELLGTATGDHDVDSYVVALGAKTGFGGFSLGGNVYIGENVGNIMALSLDGDNAWNDGNADWDGTNVVDNEAMGFILVATFKANDMFAFEAGYGYAEAEQMGGLLDDNEVQTYYVQSTITLAPGVFITPEIGVIDGEETGSEEITYYGAKWQINF